MQTLRFEGKRLATETIPALERVFASRAWLEWKLRNRSATLGARPVTLNHRALQTVSTVITAVTTEITTGAFIALSTMAVTTKE